MPARVPRQHLLQRHRFVGRFRLGGEFRCAFQGNGSRAGVGVVSRACRVYRAQQVARRLHARHDRFGQRHAEPFLDAQEELDAPEAVEAVVLLETGVERRGNGAARRMQLLGELAQGFDQRVGGSR